jgi:hypothetical protein
MNDKDLRDCFAMFALNGILACNYQIDEEPAILAYKYADDMLEARKPKEEIGLPAIKRRKKSD